ncbi:MAG: AbrB/MazE/SpoVT family DNA-binding domain-containing protein [Clostridia bacterium]|nr:AbrB/MazE/SpoVT family DNA-binding domain-containing protein [Clostridia bacterium]
MKPTGIVRPIDELGRLVLPKELRKKFNISPKDSVEFWVDGDCVVLKKYEPACIFCGEGKNMVQYENRNICSACLKKITKIK